MARLDSQGIGEIEMRARKEGEINSGIDHQHRGTIQ